MNREYLNKYANIAISPSTRCGRASLPLICVAAILIIAVGAVAWSRVGLLDIPSVPNEVSIEDSGLNGLQQMRQLDQAISSGAPISSSSAAESVRQGLLLIEQGKGADGLARMRDGIRSDPSNLVLTNAYRMAAFKLRHQTILTQRTSPTVQFPDYLEHEPLAFLSTLSAEHPARETKLSLALAWVDTMLLFPALEIKAPASVESVNILTQLLEADPWYVPALFARGLNHLHRPARLVWPEADKTPPDAAVQDIARCIAVGRKFDTGSAKLQAILAIALGDAYVKIGRYNNARSWWQIAQNLSGENSVQAAVRRRYAWRDEEILDRLEEELDRARAALDAPMTDLRMMWE